MSLYFVGDLLLLELVLLLCIQFLFSRRDMHWFNVEELPYIIFSISFYQIPQLLAYLL